MFSYVKSSLLILCFTTASFAGRAAEGDLIQYIYTSDEALLSTEAVDGEETTGLFVDFFRQVAKDANRPDVKVRRLPWKRAQRSVTLSTPGVIGPLARNPRRESQYQWIGPLFPMRLVYVTLPGAPRIDSLEVARQKIIAVKSGSAGDFGAVAHELDQNKVVSVPNQSNILRMLEKGYVDGWLVWDIIAHRAVKEFGSKHRLHEGYADTLGDLYLAASPSVSEKELSVWRASLTKNLELGKLTELLNRYLALN